jgi:alpha-methylacyl-CoA racemase
MLLADLGADVVRIDRADSAHHESGQVEPRFDFMNRGKRSITLDLKQPAAVNTVLEMIGTCDVLIEGFRPGVMERLGLGPEPALERNPKLIYGRMTGWGQDGPLAGRAGHDINYIAITGALSAIGPADGPPQVPLNLLGDFGGGGTYLVIGILAAVVERERSGLGQVIDCAIADGVTSLLVAVHTFLASGTWDDERGVNVLDGSAPFYGVYETADRKWLAVGAAEQKFYRNLVSVLAVDVDPSRQYDRDTWPATRELIAAAFRSRGADEWLDAFDDHDACVTPVLGLRAAADHPHMVHRRTIVSSDGVLQPGVAPRFSRSPTAVGRIPRDREDPASVLHDWMIDAAEPLSPGDVAHAGPHADGSGADDRARHP